MKRYIQYLKYVIKHKWFVFLGAFKVNPSLHLIYRTLIHDMSKFTPKEFISYAQTFYKPDGSKQYVETMAFNQAWNQHQKVNKHHWQYWLLKCDDGDMMALPMEQIYIEEMIADWIGAGRAITGNWKNLFRWYEQNREKMILHEETRNTVEMILRHVERNNI